ncbi:sulfurtransferase [Sphingobacterium deserti]|uniref:3-mercaptopyruvate sulfurtransferase n=1 Tax=Sphingobacterium deserti TaxID=1229276 RepID=A0A0B8T6E4_9SPHI|nr:sulfurtransferase [Sphingobacterium deserti]KGE12730.1 3-mercaptopyruvate sulfurtransferase [Sphingobacterium deserti]
MEPIISVNKLQEIAVNASFVLVDATSGIDAKTNYLISHLQGARFVDLNEDLSALEDPKHGGRHPLPSTVHFSKTLSKLGIDASSYVVVYDRLNGANAAARFWWMAKAAGIKQVQVLNGGYDAAVAAGFPVAAGETIFATQKSYSFTDWDLPLCSLHDVKQLTNDLDSLIIDVREEVRYQGISEPLDLIAGHIPTAVNIPFHNNLNADGLFKEPSELKRIYERHLAGKKVENIVVHCGSGVTACHSLLALAHAGYSLPNLYVGSWSEWSRNDLPIALGR